MRNLSLNLVLLAVLGTAGSARPSPITIEPDNYANGTVLNTISPAVTLFTSVTATDLTSNFGYNVTAQEDAGFGHTSTGVRVFAQAGVPFFNSTRNLRMTFTDPVQQLSLDFIPSSFAEAGTLSFYNASGQLLGTLQTTNPVTDVPQTLSLFRPTADVKFAVASGTGPFVRLDNLRFDARPTAVPEPVSVAAWGVIGLAGCGAAVVRRVRQRA
jgi:hypothetical protein